MPVAKEKKKATIVPLWKEGCVQVPCYFMSDGESPLYSGALL